MARTRSYLNRKELAEKFPALENILALELEPWSGESVRFDRVTVRVEPASRELLFRRGANVALGRDRRYLFNKKQGNGKRVGRRGEYLFAVDGEHRVANCLIWPQDNPERRRAGDPFVREIFFQEDPGGGPLFEQVAYLVWVTVEECYAPTERGTFGELCGRTAIVTVFPSPTGGFRRLYDEANYEEDLYLNNRIITEPFALNDPNIVTIRERLSELCRLFQENVYENGLRTLIADGGASRLSNRYGAVLLTCDAGAGPRRFVLETPGCWIGLGLGSRGELVIRSVGGTLASLRTMIETVVEIWSTEPQMRYLYPAG